MALSRIKTWVAETLFAADLNAELNNIIDNALSLISPLTGNLNANNNQITALVLEKLGANPTAATEGRIFYNTARDYAGVDDSSAIRQLLDAHHGAGLLWGLTLSNDSGDATNDIGIAVGACVNSTNVAAMRLTSAYVKQLDAAWTVGSAVGGRMSAAGIANTTYHVFLIQRVDTGVVDVGFDTSATAPTLPTNYTLFRRIGSILREAGVIVPFVQDGDLFTRKTVSALVTGSNPGTANVDRVLYCPIGIYVEAIILLTYTTNDAAGTQVYIRVGDPDETDQTPAAGTSQFCGSTINSGSGGDSVGGVARVRTNTAATIKSRVSFSSANTAMNIGTLGWVDTRGRKN